MTRVAGITGISSKSGPTDDQSWPDLDAKTIKTAMGEDIVYMLQEYTSVW